MFAAFFPAGPDPKDAPALCTIAVVVPAVALPFTLVADAGLLLCLSPSAGEASSSVVGNYGLLWWFALADLKADPNQLAKARAQLQGQIEERRRAASTGAEQPTSGPSIEHR